MESKRRQEEEENKWSLRHEWVSIWVWVGPHDDGCHGWELRLILCLRRGVVAVCS